jgi:hypothetical protein
MRRRKPIPPLKLKRPIDRKRERERERERERKGGRERGRGGRERYIEDKLIWKTEM